MKRRTFLTSLATTGAATLASQPALAQENTTKTTTTQKPEPQSVVREVGSVDILDYDYTDGAFNIQMRTDAPVSTATISEQVTMESAGSGRFNIRQLNLTEGNVVETTIPAQKFDNKAVVTITTSQSINDGYGVMLQAGNGFELFNSPANWGLVGVGSVGGFTGGIYGAKRREQAAKDEQKKRDMEVVE
ncbi:hypothetical protein [Haloarchaeobius sp. DYHT-AS-18]|uniref:hypothetical protein n=1 Tax=Haloarchaeobius sp. DYHT-AS-18 TaxID=3446117 RepID=UPI003EC09812